MKKLAARRLLLEGCTLAVMLTGISQAGPPDVRIVTPAEAHAFHDDAPFVFSGQSLSVDTSFATDRPVSLDRRASVFVGEGVRFALNGVVSASAPPVVAPLEKRGPGMLALGGANVHTSNTVLREGSLHVSGAAPFGHPINTFEQHAGTLLHFDAGTRILNYIQAAPTRPGDTPLAGLEDRVEWRVDAGTATAVNTVNALVPIRKTGEGVLQVTGAILGMTVLHIDGGALALDGTMSGRVQVGEGARLEGRGEFGSALVARGGMLAPAGRDDAGRLFTWGDLQFDPDSLYHVNAYPDGRADLLEAIGTARLDGRVWAEAAMGDWLPEHRYTILAAGGGLDESRFAGVDANLAFLTPALDYDENHVYLTLSRNDVKPGDVAETPDDRDVGEVIDPPAPPQPEPPVVPDPPAEPEPPTPSDPIEPSNPVEPPAPVDTGDPMPSDPPSAPGVETDPVETPGPVVTEPESVPLTPLQRAMFGMTREQARSALRQMTGSWHASLRSFLIEDSRYVRQAVLASAPESGVAGPRAWAHGYAASGRRGAVNAAAGDRHDSRGVVLGLDAPVGSHWHLGGVFGARHARLERHTWPASGTVESVDAGVAAHGRWSGWRLTASLLRTWHRIESRRRVSAGPLQNLLGATTTGRSWQAFIEIAPRLRRWREWGAPYLRHSWVRLHVPEFQESGGAAAHRVEAASTDMHATTLGWRLDRAVEWGGRPLVVQADAGWRHVWGATHVESVQGFVSQPGAPGRPPAVFRSPGQPLLRNGLALGLAVRAEPAKDMRLSVRYGGLYGGGRRDHAGWAEVQWVF